MHLSLQMLFMQPRVISVHSYYLTSLVTSHFCRFCLDKVFSVLQHSFARSVKNYVSILSFVRSHCAGRFPMEKICLGWLQLRFVAFFDSQQVMKNDLLSSDFWFLDLRSSKTNSPSWGFLLEPLTCGFAFENLGSCDFWNSNLFCCVRSFGEPG